VDAPTFEPKGNAAVHHLAVALDVGDADLRAVLGNDLASAATFFNARAPRCFVLSSFYFGTELRLADDPCTPTCAAARRGLVNLEHLHARAPMYPSALTHMLSHTHAGQASPSRAFHCLEPPLTGALLAVNTGPRHQGNLSTSEA
jgi:hypothetical protein